MVAVKTTISAEEGVAAAKVNLPEKPHDMKQQLANIIQMSGYKNLAIYAIITFSFAPDVGHPRVSFCKHPA